MGLQRVGHDWATELNWAEDNGYFMEIWVYLMIKAQLDALGVLFIFLTKILMMS